MLQPRLDKIIKEIAEKYSKHPDIIEAVFRSQLNTIHETIKSADVMDESTWKNCRMKYLGTLRYNKSMLLKIKEVIVKKQCQDTTEESESTNK